MAIKKSVAAVEQRTGAAATPVTPPPRRRGRPPKLAPDGPAGEGISRELIIARAVELAKVEPLSEISIIALAREFGVTPALIHYYVGSRDDILSGVVNAYFRARVEHMPPRSGDWRLDLEQHARASFALMLEYGGVLRYVMTHNRFRLFQQVGAGETDFGMVYFNRLAEIFKDGGFSSDHAAMGYHMLSQYTLASAYADISRQLPGMHQSYIDARLAHVSDETYPGAAFVAKPFARIQSPTAFEMGLTMLLDGFARWRDFP